MLFRKYKWNSRVKMSLSKTLISSVAFIVGVLSPTLAIAQASHGIAAVVNDDIVTTYDLQQRARFMMATQGVEQSEEAQQRIIQQAMRNLVDEKLQIQEAKKYDQTISEGAVSNGVQNLISRNGISVEEFAQRLASAGISLSTLQDQVRAEIAWQRIIGGLYGSRIRISDAQIDETVNRLSANADKPSYRVSEIYIEATPDIGGMSGALQGAEAMIAQLQQGAPFDILARQFSSSATAANGGEIGWIREGELREELNSVIVGMEKGSVAEPISVPGGVYVIALIDTRISTSETFYTLSQINYAYSDESELPAARVALREAAAAATSCDTLENDMEAFEGVGSDAMGEIKSSDLTEEILEKLAKTNIGAVSEPLETPASLVALMVCEREIRGSNIPSRDQVEDRLLSQQEAQASRRHLRNLRRNATIVTR
jgi:peptidyl-prolyl cis-trans isomerase SurA